MRLALLIAGLLLAAVPSTASAAPFGELPFRPVRSSAVCLSPTGTPGELVRWAPGGAELLSATPAGLVPTATIALGPMWTCPVAATDASGAGVVASAGTRAVRISVRDPGGAWGAPLVIPTTVATSISAATSARGDAVVAWAEYEQGSASATAHVSVVRRVAGGAFGAPQRLEGPFEYPSVRTAATADGAALLVLGDRRSIQLATAAPGAPFGAPRTLARDASGSGLGLAVTPAGRALLVADTESGLAQFDREPGGDFIRRPTLRFGGGDLAVALAADGTAIVASESSGNVGAIMRDGLGPFGAPITLQVAPRSQSFGAGISLIGGDGGPPIEVTSSLRAALGADQRAMLAWSVEGHGLRVATVTAAGSTELSALGGPVRGVLGATPLLLADGTRAVAWTDGNDILSVPPYAGRLHFAVEGRANTPTPAAPTLTVGAPRDASLRPAEDLVLPVRCSAACDIRASLRRGTNEPTLSLERAGTALLRFKPFGSPVAPARKALRVELMWSAPAATTAKTRTVPVRLRRLPAPPFPRLRNVRARRGPGGVVDVRWSTDVGARDVSFLVVGSRTRNYRTEREPAVGGVTGAGRRVFHVRLRDAASARYVRVEAYQLAGRRTRAVTVSVRSRA